MNQKNLIAVLIIGLAVAAAPVLEASARRAKTVAPPAGVYVADHFDLHTLQRLNRTSDALLTALVRGDEGALRAALLPSREAVGTGDIAHLLRVMSEAYGGLRSHRVLGTVPHSNYHASTLVQLAFAEGTEVVRLRWYGEKLGTLQRAAPPVLGRPVDVVTARH